MDTEGAIITALLAGAAAIAKDFGSLITKDAYRALKAQITKRYDLSTSIAQVESDPGNATFQNALATELRSKFARSPDNDVIKMTEALHTALLRESPDQLRKIGIEIGTIRAAQNVIIRGATGEDGGLKAKLIQAGGDVVIENIHGGPSQGK